MSDGPDRYAVLGNPVAHSCSPFIHAEFARQTGHHIRYGRVLCPMEGFEAAVRGFAASHEGGAGPALGCNVTIPFKFEAPRLAAHVSARAVLAQAANVLQFAPEGWRADNTDGVGLVRDLQHNADFDLVGKRVLLIGAGGAAAGVLGPLMEAGARARDGLGMLVEQAAEAFCFWRGVRPQTQPVLHALRAQIARDA